MPHQRQRFANDLLSHSRSFWPVTGVVGPRQVGKTTLLMQSQAGKGTFVSLDQRDQRELAQKSPDVFVSRLEKPAFIDEVQKCPDIFDAIKYAVDQKRRPGDFIVSGSTQFSRKIGIRESLTGRIGMIRIFPMSLAEAMQKPAQTQALPKTPRFSLDDFTKHAQQGGMPVPMFMRDKELIKSYWGQWLETTIYRDAASFFKRGYDPELMFNILKVVATALADGDLATLKNFQKLGSARKTRGYLEILEDLFVLRRWTCHPAGTGKEVWTLFDSGLVHAQLDFRIDAASTLAIVRHMLTNETAMWLEMQRKRDSRFYFKSARGSPVDWVMDDIPYKIVTSLKSIGWEEKSLIGAMKALGSNTGYLIAPITSFIPPEGRKGIGIIPWCHWS